MTMESLNKDLIEFMQSKEFFSIEEKKQDKKIRIKCAVTGHECLPTVEALQTHMKSKKFLKMKQWYSYDFSQYEPFIVPHRRNPKALYCNVTKTLLNRIPEQVKRHVEGKKYQRMKENVKHFEEKKSNDHKEFDGNQFEFENAQLIYSDEDSNTDSDSVHEEEEEKNSPSGHETSQESGDESIKEDNKVNRKRPRLE